MDQWKESEHDGGLMDKGTRDRQKVFQAVNLDLSFPFSRLVMPADPTIL